MKGTVELLRSHGMLESTAAFLINFTGLHNMLFLYISCSGKRTLPGVSNCFR